MNYIIFDLEATCDDCTDNYINEIIEIGAVKINNNNVTRFNKFIKPIINPVLTPFCKELTSIKQEYINHAQTFPYVISDFKYWIGREYILCSWGFYDKWQLIKDCQRHNLVHDWVTKHISLKHQFADLKNIKPCGMKKALNILKLPMEGTHHRGIDDANNIYKIFTTLFNEWNFKIK